MRISSASSLAESIQWDVVAKPSEVETGDVHVLTETEEPGRVLVVDDLEANAELLLEELEDQGFVARAVYTGAECLELARTWRPEVILLDVSMPVMDGIATCERLKAEPETQAIPVLFVTAFRDDEETTVRALEAGGNDFVTKPFSPAILGARVRTQLTIFRTQRALRRLAMRDDLTDLFSRRFLMTTVRQQIAQRQRDATSAFAVILMDIDHFKTVNDRFGHLVGDRVLKQVASILRECSREGDIVARYGGEEFVLIVPNADVTQASQFAERLRKRIAEETAADVSVTVSAGVAAWKPSDDTSWREPQDIVEEVLKRADMALYNAKGRGRNRVSQGPLAIVEAPDQDNEESEGGGSHASQRGGGDERSSEPKDGRVGSDEGRA